MILLWLYRTWRARRARPAELGSSVDDRRSDPSGAKSAVRLVIHQLRYNVLGFTRNRQARFYTLVLPVLFLVIFVGVFGNHTVGVHGVRASTYYVPGIAALGVISASFMNLVVTVTTQRETGILKRRRATPVPAAVVIVAQTLTAVLISAVVLAVVIAIGQLAYGISLEPSALPAIALVAATGSLTFGCLSYAVATAITSVDSAQPIVQAIMLPLEFISGIFIPTVELPRWLQHVADVFPVQHFANGLHHAFGPTVHAGSLPWADLGVMALWGAAGLLVAVRRFTWVPSVANA